MGDLQVQLGQEHSVLDGRVRRVHLPLGSAAYNGRDFVRLASGQLQSSLRDGLRDSLRNPQQQALLLRLHALALRLSRDRQHVRRDLLLHGRRLRQFVVPRNPSSLFSDRQASMQNPSRFENALVVSLLVPGVVYILFAVCGVIFYANDPRFPVSTRF